MSSGGEEKKIIIDEDWKSQAQAEKEALERQKKQLQGTGDAAEATAGGRPASAEAAQLPPATLTTLCTTLATQAMLSMGQLPNPLTGRAEIQLDYARHYIDTLEMLEKKTEGNRTPEEIAMMSQLLHELRLAYVDAQKAVAEAVRRAEKTARSDTPSAET